MVLLGKLKFDRIASSDLYEIFRAYIGICKLHYTYFNFWQAVWFQHGISKSRYAWYFDKIKLKSISPDSDLWFLFIFTLLHVGSIHSRKRSPRRLCLLWENGWKLPKCPKMDITRSKSVQTLLFFAKNFTERVFLAK
jgi:hypothetical protein